MSEYDKNRIAELEKELAELKAKKKPAEKATPVNLRETKHVRRKK